MVTAAVLPPLRRSPGQEREEAWETESAPCLGDRVILSSPFPVQFPSVTWGVEGPRVPVTTWEVAMVIVCIDNEPGQVEGRDVGLQH